MNLHTGGAGCRFRVSPLPSALWGRATNHGSRSALPHSTIAPRITEWTSANRSPSDDQRCCAERWVLRHVLYPAGTVPIMHDKCWLHKPHGVSRAIPIFYNKINVLRLPSCPRCVSLAGRLVPMDPRVSVLPPSTAPPPAAATAWPNAAG